MAEPRQGQAEQQADRLDEQVLELLEGPGGRLGMDSQRTGGWNRKTEAQQAYGGPRRGQAGSGSFIVYLAFICFGNLKPSKRMESHLSTPLSCCTVHPDFDPCAVPLQRPHHFREHSK
jgi:hypothetical protein